MAGIQHCVNDKQRFPWHARTLPVPYEPSLCFLKDCCMRPRTLDRRHERTGKTGEFLLSLLECNKGNQTDDKSDASTHN
jgi:hypothetical protein